MEEYLVQCRAAGVRPNSGLSQMFIDGRLPMKLSFQNNYIGDRGLGPFLQTAKENALLEGVLSIDLSGQGLRDEGIGSVVQELQGCRSLTALDLSDNVIGDRGGKELLAWVRRNPQLVSLELLGTRIGPELKWKLSQELGANKNKRGY